LVGCGGWVGDWVGGGGSVGRVTEVLVGVGSRGVLVVRGVELAVGVAVRVAEGVSEGSGVRVGWPGGAVDVHNPPRVGVTRAVDEEVIDRGNCGVTVGTAVSRPEMIVERRSGASVARCWSSMAFSISPIPTAGNTIETASAL
jgi:hypothetical protein